MNSAQLVNLILSKSKRVEFVSITANDVEFILGHKKYFAYPDKDHVRVRNVAISGVLVLDDNYSRWVEGVLNGMVRNDAGKMVKP